MSKSRVTIVFECDTKYITHPKYIGLLELNNLVLKAMQDRTIQVSVEEITNDPE